MSTRTWLRNLFAARTPRTLRKAPARRRPSLEALEDRVVPITFVPTAHYAFPGIMSDSVAVGDINRDGRPDLVTSNFFSNNVSVLLGNGNGTFQGAVSYAAGAAPRSVAVGDFNGDTRPDLAVRTAAGWVGGVFGDTVAVLLGNGNGTFQGAVSYAAGPVRPLDFSNALAVGDFNGDGRLDLVTQAAILLGNGNGTFQQAREHGGAGSHVAVGDFNGDGRLDLAITRTEDLVSRVGVLLGNGNGTFQGAAYFATALRSNSVKVGDFNGDGRSDLVVASEGENSVHVLLGNGNGTFRSNGHYAVQFAPLSVAVGDFNRDGRSDLATANSSGGNNYSVLMGNGNGSFQSSHHYGDAAGSYAVAVGDFNGDHWPDLATVNLYTHPLNSVNGVSVLLNNNPPTIARNLAAVTVNEGSPATNSGTFDDAQGPGTVTLTASLGTLTRNDAAGTWSWSYTPPDGPAGPTTVTITATDQGGLVASTTFTLTVLNVAPTITSITVPATGTMGSPVTLSATATDPAGASDPLTFTWTITRPDTSTFTPTGASASFTPAGVGSYGVSLTVNDGDGGIVTQTFTLPVYTRAASEKFVQALFKAELGRAASTAEVASWLNVLGGSGGQSAVVTGIANSTEARARVVTGWYQTYLGRSPSATETSAQANALASQTQEQVLSGILGSTEFFSRAQTMGFGGTANENFVRALYQVLLGRTASTLEVATNVSALPQLGQSGVALGILQSTEYRADVVNGYYTSLLHRTGSSAEIASWVNTGLDLHSISMGLESSLEFFANG